MTPLVELHFQSTVLLGQIKNICLSQNHLHLHVFLLSLGSDSAGTAI